MTPSQKIKFNLLGLFIITILNSIMISYLMDITNIITVIPITNEMRGLHNLTNKLSLKFNLPI
jgi:hypothetical protein